MNKRSWYFVLILLLAGMAGLLPAGAAAEEGIAFHCTWSVLRKENPGLYLSVELVNQSARPADLRHLEVKVTDASGTRTVVPGNVPKAVVQPGRRFCFPVVLEDGNTDWAAEDLTVEISCGGGGSPSGTCFGVVEGSAEILRQGNLFAGVLLESRFPESETTREEHVITLGFYDSNGRFLYAAEVPNDDEIPPSPGGSVWLEWSPFRGEVSEENLILARQEDVASVRAFTTYPENENTPLLWNAYTYQILADGSVQITGYFGSEAELSVPAEIDGYPVTSLAEYAFYDHEELLKLELPESLTAMERLSVAGCSRLQAVSLPAGLQEIGAPQFFECPALEEILLPAGCRDFRAEDNVLFRNTDNTLIRFPQAKAGHTYSIPRGTAAVADGAFNACGNLIRVNFPEGLEEIGEWAFEYCDHLQDAALPSSLRTIGTGAFMGTALTSAAVPGQVTALPDYCFTKCESLRNAALPDTLLSIGQSAFRECPLSTVDLPEGLQKIGDLAFMQCEELEILRIPASVQEIGMGVFSSCARLSSLTLDPGNERFELAGGALYDRTEHRLICALPQLTGARCGILPGTLKIDPTAFSGNQTLLSVTLPDSLLSIGDFAFSDCTGLQRIRVPESAKDCGQQVFEGCSGLEEAILPDSWTVIPAGTFSGCNALHSVHIPASLRKIEKQAFRGCSALTSVTLPEQVRTIEDHAFAMCSALASVNLPASLEELGEGILYQCPEVTAAVSEGSAAEQYCRENGIRYERSDLAAAEP